LYLADADMILAVHYAGSKKTKLTKYGPQTYHAKGRRAVDLAADLLMRIATHGLIPCLRCLAAGWPVTILVNNADL